MAILKMICVHGWIVYHMVVHIGMIVHIGTPFGFGLEVVCWPNNQTIELLYYLPCANIGDNVEFRFGDVGILTLLQSFTYLCLLYIALVYIVFFSEIV